MHRMYRRQKSSLLEEPSRPTPEPGRGSNRHAHETGSGFGRWTSRYPLLPRTTDLYQPCCPAGLVADVRRGSSQIRSASHCSAIRSGCLASVDPHLKVDLSPCSAEFSSTQRGICSESQVPQCFWCDISARAPSRSTPITSAQLLECLVRCRAQQFGGFADLLRRQFGHGFQAARVQSD